MKTKKQVETRIKETKKQLLQTEESFDRTDNVDDMHLIPVLENEIQALQWVLEK
jgi:hypothetical protein